MSIFVLDKGAGKFLPQTYKRYSEDKISNTVKKQEKKITYRRTLTDPVTIQEDGTEIWNFHVLAEK